MAQFGTEIGAFLPLSRNSQVTPKHSEVVVSRHKQYAVNAVNKAPYMAPDSSIAPKLVHVM